jgi:hypothetical protein
MFSWSAVCFDPAEQMLRGIRRSVRREIARGYDPRIAAIDAMLQKYELSPGAERLIAIDAAGKGTVIGSTIVNGTPTWAV